MRLDDAPDFSDISVQCLGKNYRPTQDAWHCLDEVRELHKEYNKDKNDPDHSRAKVFNEVEQKYLHQKPASGAVHDILAGFGIIDSRDNETPKQRVNRFKEDLRSQEFIDKAQNSINFTTGWFGY